jgi:uncharacterized oligopeptide transporter (OPT) family protein
MGRAFLLNWMVVFKLVAQKINLSLFGEELPSFLRIVMTFLIFVIMGFAIYGYMADFIPSASWSTTSLYLSICITVAAISAHYYLLAIGYTSLYGEKSKTLNVLSLLLFRSRPLHLCGQPSHMVWRMY